MYPPYGYMILVKQKLFNVNQPCNRLCFGNFVSSGGLVWRKLLKNITSKILSSTKMSESTGVAKRRRRS